MFSWKLNKKVLEDVGVTETQFISLMRVSAEIATDILIPAVIEQYQNDVLKAKQEFEKETLDKCVDLDKRVAFLEALMKTSFKEKLTKVGE
jgi:phosphoenolpyruvate-protein kinase (PTS system EI component)